MFKGNLFKFQEFHENQLLKKCASYQELVLDAPTGSGKTILCCKFIDDYFDENPHTVFLWLCPGAGGLQSQSQEVFNRVTQGIPSGDVYSFTSESNPEGHVYFINWDKINRNSNLVLQEGEHKDLLEKIAFCHKNKIAIFMIIDEEHKYKDTANEYIEKINPFHVLRVSATPISGGGEEVEKITDEEVIAAGLITSGISINEGVSKAIEENNSIDDDLLLLHLADQKRKELQAGYEKRGLNIRPLVLIQFPNASLEWIERIKKELDTMGYSSHSGLVASWFSGDHPDQVDEIKRLDGQYAFLLFKQAIATGWDCPRAKILVKLRERGTDSFQIQTIGRIRRMPEGKHYDSDLLNNCYVYTLDKKFEEGLISSLSESFKLEKYERKYNCPSFLLQKESLNGSDRYAVNPKSVIAALKKAFLKECDFVNGEIDRKKLEFSKGYLFGTKLKTEAFEGVARTTHDMMRLNHIFGGEHEINNHDDGFIIRDAKRKIAAAIGIDESISNKALKILFGPEDDRTLFSEEEIQFEEENKLLKQMNLRMYNAFLVNNRDRLVELFTTINEEEILDVEPTDILVQDWFIPKTQYYKYHKKIDSLTIMKKNVFLDYGDNILIQPNRSYTEIVFEDWCETYDTVKWIYKNGDKGDAYFSLVYRKGFRRNNFYPDYIIQLQNGEIWIIEAKGGMNADGSSKNIDPYARHKFNALKEYASRHSEIHWGFVRAVGKQLYLSNTEWVEDVTNRKVWRPIEVFLPYLD